MKRNLIIIVALILFGNNLFAQQTFITKGKIEFEKRVNVHKNLEVEEDQSFVSMLKKSVPQFKVTYFDLYFDNKKTIYKPGREVVTAQKIPDWADGPANDNIVFSDLETKTFSSQKTVFESVFNIQDTIRKIDWKISMDTRTIAGFECRKATAIIMDSVYVVAFYTDQVVAPGGPESFTGLPGMILGLALPRMNSTYFATKIEVVEVKETMLVAPKKGKKTNIADLKTQLKSSFKDWGTHAEKNIWQILI